MSHILVIDDEPSISEVICRFLTKFGHTVETATDGLHGLRLLKKGSFGLVITDMCISSVRPEIGKLGRDQGFRKILPQAYG